MILKVFKRYMSGFGDGGDLEGYDLEASEAEYRRQVAAELGVEDVVFYYEGGRYDSIQYRTDPGLTPDEADLDHLEIERAEDRVWNRGEFWVKR